MSIHEMLRIAGASRLPASDENVPVGFIQHMQLNIPATLYIILVNQLPETNVIPKRLKILIRFGPLFQAAVDPNCFFQIRY